MVWWVPLIAAAVNAISADQKKKQAEKDATADTVNRIKQHHAQSLGADPSLGMAVDNAINIGRADRDYQPPVNAVGAAIQAIGKDKPLVDSGNKYSFVPEGSAGLGAESAASAVADPLLRDPWDLDPSDYL